MVGVGGHAKLVEKGSRCLGFVRNLSCNRQSLIAEAFLSDGFLPVDETALTFCCNEDFGVIAVDEKLETHSTDGNCDVLGSNGELETFCDHGSHETLRSHGGHGTLYGNGIVEALYSKERLARLRRSSKIPSNEDIQTLCKNGDLQMALKMLPHMQTIPSLNTYLVLLQACTKQNSLTHVKRVYTHLANHYLHLSTFLGGYVVNALAKCGGLKEALHLFGTLPHRTVHSYSCLICMLVDRCQGQAALQLWVLMQEEGIEPNQYTYVGLLKACGSIRDLEQGKTLHEEVQVRGLGDNVFVGSALVCMYSRCGDIHEAENAFSELTEHNVVMWNAMLTAYVEHKEGGKALLVFRQMLEQCPDTDQGTFVLALQACGILAEKMQGFVKDAKPMKTGVFHIGQALHAHAWREGFDLDVVVGSALVTMYGKCGAFTDAENVFFRLVKHDVAFWNAMLSAHVDAGEGRKSLRLYLHMQAEGIIPDRQTVTIALRACGLIAEKEETVVVKQQATRLLPAVIIQAIEEDVRRNDIVADEVYCNTLIFVYGKCGDVARAEQVFLGLPDRSTLSWNAMLSVYIEHHEGNKALQAYKRFQEELVTPDDVSLIYALQACNEVGCLETCRAIHFSLTSADLELDTLLSTTLLRTYGSCASMKDAESTFNELLEPDMLSWDACITGYTQCGNCTDTLEMIDKMQMEFVDPDGITLTLALSACNHGGLVEEGVDYFNLMAKGGYVLSPDLRHYGTLIDLYGRAGNFSRVKAIIGKMPMQPDLAIWLCLLNASVIHGNTDRESWGF